MSQLHENVGRGGAYEAFADAVISQIASMVPVPREEDFGTDFYCLPRQPIADRLETAAELCGIQVKGGAAADQFFLGGCKKDGPWREHSLQWFASLDVPLYIATVDSAFSRVDLYSTAPALGAFWRAGTPFRVNLRLGEPTSDQDASVVEPRCAEAPDGAGYGDGKTWDVDLGPPFLSLTLPELNDEATRAHRRDLLRSWIVADRLSFLNVRRHLPRLTLFDKWRTNWLPTPPIERQWSFWRDLPGANLQHLILEAGPVLGILAKHLNAQGDADGFAAVLPAIEWLKSRGVSDGLVNELCSRPPSAPAAG